MSRLKATQHRLLLIASMLLVFAASGVTSAQAATLVVTKTADTDDGSCTTQDCSLREALDAANADPDASTITFAGNVTGAVQVTDRLPEIDTTITIDGGAAGVTIDAGDMNGAIFIVITGKTANFKKLTLLNGREAIFNVGTTTVTDCTVRGSAQIGISNTSNGTLTVTNSTISAGTSGISSLGTATVTGSNFTGNWTGIYIQSQSSQLTVTNCTFTRNRFLGLYAIMGSGMKVMNCTITGNQNGVGINTTGTVTLTNNLIVGNTEVNVSNVSYAGSNNIIGSLAEGGLDPAGAKDNGGPTHTVALLPDSPAIDAGTATGAPATDQRGIARPQGGGVDVGAFEFMGARDSGSLVVTVVADEDDDNLSANDISLREAINFSNFVTGEVSNITFDPTVFASKQTITLGSALPALTSDVTITGPAAGVTVDGVNDSFAVFTVNGGVNAGFSGLTITNGNYGIRNYGTAAVTGSTVTGNGEYGILNEGAATVTVTNCTIGDSGVNGQGIHNLGTATVTRSTVSGSTEGVVNVGNVTVTASTLSGNAANGLFNEGTATVINSTLSGNSGGILNLGTATVKSSTLSANGLGINAAGPTTLNNSIVAGNTTLDVSGDVTSGGTNFTGGTPKLGPLQDNGGPTFTMLPAADSPVIDEGNSDQATDQRGARRPQGAADDIGAVEVGGINAAPTVSDVSKTVNEDDELTFAAGDFDDAFTDGDDDELASITITSLPTDGTLQLDGADVAVNDVILHADIADLTYTPEADFYGADSFGWNGSDGVASADQGAKVNITVAAVNDAPSFDPGRNVTVNENSGAYSANWAFEISAGPPNENDRTLTFNVSNNNNALFSSQPAISVRGVLSFTPALNQSGSATVTVSLSDNGGTDNGGDDESDEVTFTITVIAANEAPTGSDTTVSTPQDTAYTFTATDFGFSDSDEHTFAAVTIASLPQAGALTLDGVAVTAGQRIVIADINTSKLQFTPAAGAFGEDYAGFTFHVEDSSGDSDPTANTITIDVTEVVNLAPVATDDNTDTDEDTPVEIDLALLVSDDKTTDANLIYTIVAEPSTEEGTVELNGSVVTFTPATNFAGETSFTYKVEDEGGLESEVKKVTINISSEEDAPVLDPIGNKSVDELTTLSFTATATDGDDNELTFSLQGAPSGANINAQTGVFSWTPTEAQGPGSFTFKVRVYDGTSYDEEQITVTVREVNTAPVLELGGNRTLTAGVPFSFGITAYDVDIPTQGGGVSLVNAPSWINVTGGPTIYGTPPVAAAPYSVTLTVRAGDSFGAATQKSITLTVNVNTSRATWVVEPTWSATEGTLTYRLKNNTNAAISGVYVSGQLRVPVTSMTRSVGNTSWNTQGNGYYGVYWNGFNLAAGQEATLVIKVARPAKGRPVANTLYCSYGPGNQPTLTTPDVKAP